VEGSVINRVGESEQSKILQAHIQRRDRLWEKVRVEYPAYTKADIEAKLEQFGA
jgi:phage head maturation protease